MPLYQSKKPPYTTSTYGGVGGRGREAPPTRFLSGFPARGGVYLLAVAALRLGVLAFPTDLEGERLTKTGRLHYLFAIASFALAYMAIDVLNPIALPIAADWTSLVLGGLYWIVAVSLAGVVICLIPALRRVFGLVERLFLVSVMLWSAVFALAAN